MISFYSVKHMLPLYARHIFHHCFKMLPLGDSTLSHVIAFRMVFVTYFNKYLITASYKMYTVRNYAGTFVLLVVFVNAQTG
jgi:hypothetical protein